GIFLPAEMTRLYYGCPGSFNSFLPVCGKSFPKSTGNCSRADEGRLAGWTRLTGLFRHWTPCARLSAVGRQPFARQITLVCRRGDMIRYDKKGASAGGG